MNSQRPVAVSARWVQVAVGGAEVGLLAHPADPEQNEGVVELNFQAHEPLEADADRARVAGIEIAAPVIDGVRPAVAAFVDLVRRSE